MSRILFDLALADEEVRPSPYCWIVKFSLLHKGLAFETRTVPFADKSKYPDPVYGRVPVLSDNDEMVKDSPFITLWLDRKYAGSPLVATKAERAAAEFVAAANAALVFPALRPFLLLPLLNAASEADRSYFRTSREQQLGKPLEEVAAEASPARLEAALAPLAAALSSHRYLGGSTPNLADYIAFSPFMWQRSVIVGDRWDTPGVVAQWRERMLDLFDGYARAAKSANSA